MSKKIVFRIKDNIYFLMEKYSKFSGVSITSMMREALIEYLIEKKLLKFTMDKQTYNEIKEVL